MAGGLTRTERFDAWASRASPVIGPRVHRTVYRLSGGRLGTSKRGIPVGLLTTTGRQSGKPRTTPLMCLDEGDRVLVVASNAGFDAPPAWLLNVRADPSALLRVGGTEERVTARELSEAEQAECWPRLVAHNPLLGDFQRRTERRFVTVALRVQPLAGQFERRVIAGDYRDRRA